MRRMRSVFAGPAALHAIAAGLLFIYGCGSDAPTPSDLTGSGGAMSTGGTGSVSGGGSVSSGGAVNSGGAVSTGGAASSGGTVSSGGAVSSGGTSMGASGGSETGGVAGVGGGSTLVLTSPAFEDVPACSTETPSVCEVFPDENVSYLENANVSPELSWTGVPPGVQSFAVVLFDVTFGQAHWVLWNIPAEEVTLAANVPQDTKLPAAPTGSEQANANFADTSTDGYFGPHMPCNVFEFQLFALALPTFTPANPDSAVLVHAELQNLGDSLLGSTRLRGRAGDYGMTCN